MERLLDLYESVINTFTEVIAKDKDSYAIGLNESLTQFGTLALIHLFADILSPLKKLMIHFQSRDIDLDGIEVDYNICLRDLQNFGEGKIGILIFFYL